MAGSINPQDAVESIIAYLTSNLGTKLDALDTSYGDSITLPDVDAYHRAPQSIYQGSHNIVVAASATEPDNTPEVLQAHQIELLIVLTEGGSSATYKATELLQIKLWRIVRGIQELLNKSTLSDAVDKVLMENAEASEVFSDNGRVYEQMARLTLLIQTS